MRPVFGYRPATPAAQLCIRGIRIKDWPHVPEELRQRRCNHAAEAHRPGVGCVGTHTFGGEHYPCPCLEYTGFPA